MALNPYDQYRKTAVTTTSRAGQIIMLYDGLLRFTRQAVRAVERSELEDAHRNFLRAQDILAELEASLDLEIGGDTAKNLLGLYEYGYRRLVEANCRKSAAPALEVITIFHELLQAWREIDGRASDTSTKQVEQRELVGAHR